MSIEGAIDSLLVPSRLSPCAKFKMALKLKEVQRKTISQSIRKILGFL
jgi:hypothetical protein